MTTFADLGLDELLEHFRTRPRPHLWAVDLGEVVRRQHSEFPAETAELIAAADRIVSRSGIKVYLARTHREPAP